MDLRAEVDDDEWVKQVKRNYKQATLNDIDRALCDYAFKLTKTPADITQSDIDQMKSLGLTDRAINDAAQVISFFNYINRIGDGLGVDLEPEMQKAP